MISSVENDLCLSMSFFLQDREEELRAMAIQLRRREREKRHKQQEDSYNSDDSAEMYTSKSK